MEEATHDDLWMNYLLYRKALVNDIEDITGYNFESANSEALKTDDRYACVMCRVHYLRVPRPLPPAGDARAQAEYWKRWYNTSQGAGTIEHFMEADSHG